MRKLWPPKVKGGQKFKKKPMNTINANFKTPTKFLLCYLFVIMICRTSDGAPITF